MDFEAGVGEVPATFRVGNPTSRTVPTDISNKGLGNPDFPIQMERTVNFFAASALWVTRSVSTTGTTQHGQNNNHQQVFLEVTCSSIMDVF